MSRQAVIVFACMPVIGLMLVTGILTFRNAHQQSFTDGYEAGLRSPRGGLLAVQYQAPISNTPIGFRVVQGWVEFAITNETIVVTVSQDPEAEE